MSLLRFHLARLYSRYIQACSQALTVDMLFCIESPSRSVRTLVQQRLPPDPDLTVLDLDCGHEAKGALRWTLRQGFPELLQTYLAAETGDAGEEHIFSQNLLAVARKE